MSEIRVVFGSVFMFLVVLNALLAAGWTVLGDDTGKAHHHLQMMMLYLIAGILLLFNNLG